MNLGETAQQRGFAAYLRWVASTSRITFDADFGDAAIAAVWCDSVFCLLAASLPMKNVAVYVLDHPGADWMVGLVERLGFTVIMASSGGADGVRDARAWLAEPNRLLAITLDGPAGPPRVAKPGVLRLARLLRAPVFPMSVSASSGFVEEGAAGSVVPYAHGRIAARGLGRVPDGLSPSEATAWIQRAMSQAPLSRPARDGTDLRQLAAHMWARACRAPLFTGTVTLGPGLEEVSEP